MTKHKALIMGMVLIMVISSFSGCKNAAQDTKTTGTTSAGSASKVPDNLKLISETKVDEDDILYVYIDQTYHTEVYVCKNTKTNTVSISTSK